MEKVKTTFSVLFIVSFCHFLNDTIQSMLPAIYPMLKSDFGLSFSQIGLITLALQTTSSIVQPLVGLYADKHHHSWQLAVGMLFTLSGIAQLASGGRKGLAQGIFQVGGNAGFALGPLLAGIIILPHGIQSVRWFGVLAILCAILLSYVGWWHVKELKNFTRKIRERWTIAENVSRGKIHFFVFILFMLMFSKNFYSASMTNYFTFFLIDKFHLSVRLSQICLFVFLASQAIGTVLGGLIGDRFGRKPVIWFSILGAAPFTIALPYIDSFAGTIALSIVIGLIMSSAFPAILVFATDLLPNHTGIVAGIFYGLSFGLAGFGSSFFGWLADRTSVPFIFQVSTLLPLFGIIAIFLPKMERRRLKVSTGNR